MKQGIVIVTCEATKPFMDDMAANIGNYSKYPVIIHGNSPELNEYEMGGIKRALWHGFDEFFLLHDTCKIKDFSLFDIVFEKMIGWSVSISVDFLSYLGKFKRDILEQMTLPTVLNKYDAVEAEANFLKDYCKLAGKDHRVLYPDFDKNYRFEMKHGRENMVLESETLIKYKGTWHPDMIKMEVDNDN